MWEDRSPVFHAEVPAPEITDSELTGRVSWSLPAGRFVEARVIRPASWPPLEGANG